MLPDDELAKLMIGPESDFVERKESTSDADEIRKVICAFANDLADHRRPGLHFLGVRNDGTCANKPIDARAEERITDARDGDILPKPVMAVARKRLNECDVLVVQVEPAAGPPVRYRGRVWVRVGSSLRSASEGDEQKLLEKRRWGNLPFDHTPVSGAALADLEIDLFERVYLPGAVDAETLRNNNRSREQQLASLRLTTPQGIPTVGGLLVLGRTPRDWLPGAYVQFVRFAGTSLTDPIRDQKEIDGPLPEMMRQLDDLLALNIQVGLRLGEGPDVKHADFPGEALRQVVRNAVMHRTYEATHAPVRLNWFDDRVEVQSPGGPYGIVTRENFGKPGITDYRNPLVAEALKVLGYVQKFGLGIMVTRTEMSRNGNPPPVFDAESNHVLVTLRKRA